MRSIAVPLDAQPLRAIRADARLWQLAAAHPPFTTSPVPDTLPEISHAVLAALPTGSGWVDHFADRSFQQAEYLLDPVGFRRAHSWAQRERTTAYRTVHGDEVFAEHATSAQGMTWRCSSTAFLSDALDRIDALDLAAARQEFSVADMIAQGVYKQRPDEDDDHAADRVLTTLRAFSRHCRVVVADGLDLIFEQH